MSVFRVEFILRYICVLLTMNSCSNTLIVCVFRFTRVQRRMQRSAHIIPGSLSSTKGKKPAAFETLFGSVTQSVTMLICSNRYPVPVSIKDLTV